MWKQMIVLRTDLGMSVGKMVAQGAHGSSGILPSIREQDLIRWQDDGSAKIVLQVGSEKELMELFELAPFFFLKTYLVRDAGKTEVEPGTPTCLVIGPASELQINKLTSGLKLL